MIYTNSLKVYDWTAGQMYNEQSTKPEPFYVAEIFDEFNDNSNKWDLLSLDKASSSIFGGYYEIDHKVKDADFSTINIYETNSRATTVKLSAEQTRGDTSLPYGMCFGKQDVKNNFLFLINNSKKFMIGTWDNGVW
jgi:hypothetical protein